MEFQHTDAPQDGAPTEPGTSADFTTRSLTNSELREMLKGGGVTQHVRASLRSLDTLLGQLGTGQSHQHLKTALTFPESLRTRAALELVRRRTRDVEEVIRRRESEAFKAKSVWQNRSVCSAEEQAE
jgi:hypothetical protein